MLIKYDIIPAYRPVNALHGGRWLVCMLEEPMKRCSKCEEEKDPGEFHKNKTQKYGLSAWCKSCKSEYCRAHYKDNKEEILRRTKAKREEYYQANKEKIIRQTRAYYQANREKISRRAKAYDQRNKTRKAEINKVYRKSNKEKILGQKKAYRKANPEKGRIIAQRRRSKKAALPSTLTSGQWQETLKGCDYKCVYCGDLWKHQDHFVPLSKGGGYTVNNIVPACDYCNESKGAKPPFEFIKSLRSIK